MPASDQLEQIKRRSVQLIIACTGRGIGDKMAFIFERSLRPGDGADLIVATAIALGSFFLFFLADLLEQPVQRVGNIFSGAARLLDFAVSAHARRQDDVAANAPISVSELLYPLMQARDSVEIAADIEAGRDLRAAVTDAG